MKTDIERVRDEADRHLLTMVRRRGSLLIAAEKTPGDETTRHLLQLLNGAVAEKWAPDSVAWIREQLNAHADLDMRAISSRISDGKPC